MTLLFINSANFGEPNRALQNFSWQLFNHMVSHLVNLYPKLVLCNFSNCVIFTNYITFIIL